MYALAISGGLAQAGELRGFVRDSRGQPVIDAVVSLWMGTQTLTCHTDSEGAYRFLALLEGTYTLRAETAGSGKAEFGPVVLGSKEAKKVDIKLPPPPADFFDEPSFVVAGVTDLTNRGGHGSDAGLRATEALARATAELSKDSPPGSAEAEPHHLLADAAERKGNALEAAREYQSAAELDPTERNLFDWGVELLRHRAAEQAIEILSNGNRKYPRSVRMLLGLAAAWYARGNYDRAVEDFFAACDLDPSDPMPYMFLGKVQSAEIQQSQGFAERMARFAKMQPDNAWSSYYYAASLWRTKDDPMHVQSLLEKALRLDPNLSEAYLQLGILYSDQKDFPNAIAAYRKAIEITPQSEEAHYRLAKVYERSGEQVKAQEEFELHEELARRSAEASERERQEIQQFIFGLRDQTSTSQTHPQ